MKLHEKGRIQMNDAAADFCDYIFYAVETMQGREHAGSYCLN
jgi:hypothetical protein